MVESASCGADSETVINAWASLFAEMQQIEETYPLNPPGLAKLSYRELIEEGRRNSLFPRDTQEVHQD